MKKVSHFINFPVFIFSLTIGLFFVYITASPLQTILVYPTPDNINKLLYKDHSGSCHKFVPKVVKCPADKTKIKQYPIHTTK